MLAVGREKIEQVVAVERDRCFTRSGCEGLRGLGHRDHEFVIVEAGVSAIVF